MLLLSALTIDHWPLTMAQAHADFAVTDATVSLRLKAESRDDRNLEQSKWGDRDLLGEWRVRGNVSLTQERWRLDLELQDQRIPTSQPALFLDTSPMPTPASTAVGAGLRLAGRVRYRFAGGSEAALGMYPVEAAGGLLLGANEYGTGYRPLGFGFSTAGFQARRTSAGARADSAQPVTTLWIGMHSWNEIVGATLLTLTSHARQVGPARVEVGAIGRRTPSRPLYAGVQELTGTPYVSMTLPFAERFSLTSTGAFQFGLRHYLPKSSGLAPETLFNEGHYPRKFSAYYSGDSGSRIVRAGFARAALDARLPIAWNPTLTIGGSAGSGGGSGDYDRNYVGFVFDTHKYFGRAGYFGQRNTRALFSSLAVPFRNGWSTRVAIWQVEVPSPHEGLFLENGSLMVPELLPYSRRQAATSHDAFKEWDAEMRWAPSRFPFAARLSYAEVRHGRYLKQAARIGHRIPPVQWAAFQVDLEID